MEEGGEWQKECKTLQREALQRPVAVQDSSSPLTIVTLFLLFVALNLPCGLNKSSACCLKRAGNRFFVCVCSPKF